jgi:hypothetical protein
MYYNYNYYVGWYLRLGYEKKHVFPKNYILAPDLILTLTHQDRVYQTMPRNTLNLIISSPCVF